MNKLIIAIFLSVFLISCNSERYRKDRSNRLTRKARKATDFHAKQAVNLTQSNIEKRDKTERKTAKRKDRIQSQLNELNAKSKIKSSRRHTGQFNLY